MFDDLGWDGQQEAPVDPEPPVVPEPVAESEASADSEPFRYPPTCPYLGLPDDARTHFSFADPAHRCHVKAKLVPIDLGHQGSFCLTPQFPACKRYVPPKAIGAAGGSAPVPVATSDPPAAAPVAPVAPVTTATKGAWMPPTDPGKGRGVGRPAALVAVLVVLALVALIGAGSFTDLVGGSAATGTPESSVEVSTPPSASIQPTVSTPTEAPTVAPTQAPASEAAATSAPTPEATATIYVVARGDSLLSIAARFGVTVKAIRKANNITDPNLIVVGQKLVIPLPR